MKSRKEILLMIYSLKSGWMNGTTKTVVYYLEQVLANSQMISIKDVFINHANERDCNVYQKLAVKCGYDFLEWNGIIYNTVLFAESFERSRTPYTLEDLV